jgi:antitoxin (DNA-binding transcriptional repressor) of toxin-antitoxin stability system
MEIGIKEAKTSLSRLVTQAQKGDRVFLTNRGQRVIELVAVKAKADQPPHRGLGMYSDVKLPPGFGSKKQRRAATQSVLKDMALA